MDLPVVREATLEEILPLRKRMLIDGTGRPNPCFDGEEEPTTFHIGAFVGGACVACSTWMPSEWDGEPAWRLRGMATDTTWQGRGLGKALLAYAEEKLSRRGVDLCWCTARTSATTFYEKCQWRVIGNVFHIPGVGPHVRMIRSIR
jgi:GNAT superfamily N-acetyltransferase